MNKDEFKNEYSIDDKYIDKIYINFNMDNKDTFNNICFLMPIINKLVYLKTKHKDVLMKDIEKGNIKNLTFISEEYKCIDAMIEKGVDIDTIINFMIEMITKTVNIMFSDDDLYTKTADKEYREHFGIEQKEENNNYKVLDIFNQLLDIFEIK